MPYHPAMTSRLPPWTRSLAPLALLASLTLLLPACNKGSEETASETGSSGGTTAAPTTGTSVPTTSTTVPTTTTDEPTTGTSASGSGSGTDASTTVVATTTDTGQCVDCIGIADEIACVNTPECRWSGVVGYTYSAQGCVGNITNFCTAKDPAGVATAMWRDIDGGQQVVEFAYTPECLADEWKPCDCDGPLACLCTSVTADCPDRLEEFCAVNINELGCSNAQIKGEAVCHSFKVAPEGPVDDKCEVKQAKNLCLPATDIDVDTCDKIQFDYPNCGNQQSIPVFWRDNNGTIELIQSCGPVPTGFTACEAVDTPEQPDECGLCTCL